MIEILVGCLVVWAIAYRAGGPIEKSEDHGYRPDLERK